MPRAAQNNPQVPANKPAAVRSVRLKPQPDTRSPRHFALRVPDAKAAREHCRSHGVEIQETGPIPHCDRFCVHYPDGNRIELIQWIEPYDPAGRGAARLD